jgi:hypothetical protein
VASDAFKRTSAIGPMKHAQRYASEWCACRSHKGRT